MYQTNRGEYDRLVQICGRVEEVRLGVEGVLRDYRDRDDGDSESMQYEAEEYAKEVQSHRG
jgi:hypothetical protein